MILVDNRVGAVELVEPLSNRGVLIKTARLDFSDFCFMGNGPKGPVRIGIERKRILDLINSMITGRLSGHQLIGMLKDYDYSYLLVEGVWRGNAKSGVAERLRGRSWVPIGLGSRTFMRREIDNYLNTLSIIGGLYSWFTPNINSSAAWLLSLYGWWQKKWTDHKSHTKFNKSNGGRGGFSLVRPSLAMRVAAELSGVGEGKGRKVGKHFKTVEGLMEADEKSFMEVEGIGNKLAKSMYEQLRGKVGTKNGSKRGY